MRTFDRCSEKTVPASGQGYRMLTKVSTQAAARSGRGRLDLQIPTSRVLIPTSWSRFQLAPDLYLHALATHLLGPHSNVQGLDSYLMAPDSNLQGPDSNLEAPNSNLQAPDHSFQATESNLQRPDSTSRLQIPTSQKQIPTARLQIPTYRVQSQPAPDSNLHGPSRAWARGPRPEAMGQWAEASWGSEA